jgi:hypothetical protein
LQGLKGFDSNAKIKIGAFTVFSDNNTLAQPMTDTTYDFHKVAKVSVYSVANYADAVQLGCTANMQIPGAVTTSLLLSYQAPATREIKSFSLYVESKGKVYFNAYENEATGYKFIDNSFTSTGTLHFENDDPNDGKRIELVGILTRKFENGSYTTEITLPKVSGIYQKIALSGTSGSYLDVIEGLQQVVSGQWDYLRYTGDLVTSDTSTLKDNRLNYVVSGAVEVDKDGNNQIAITDVQTPLGGLCIVFDWSTATFVGTLSISDPGINIGPAVKLKEGLFEIAFSGNGFYFDLVGKVSISGLEAFADVNFGLLAGYYTELPDMVIERHNGIMSLKKVPEELVNEGIKGLYLNLNFSPPAANWDTEIPLVLVTVYAGVNLGIDVAMMLHFGEQTKKFVLDVGAIAGAYAGVNILGVCTFCMSVNGIFDATGEVDLNTGNPNLFGCASLTIKGEAVCMGKLEATAGCTVQFAEKPKDPPVNTPENQGNTDESADNANDTPEIPQTEDNKYPKISLQWTPCGGSDKFNQSNGECGEL